MSLQIQAVSELPGSVFLATSMFNHSCVANAHFQFLGDHCLIVAVKDIKAGEEVTISYMMPIEPYEQRVATMKDHFGFECDCRLCEDQKSLYNGPDKSKLPVYDNSFQADDVINLS